VLSLLRFFLSTWLQFASDVVPVEPNTVDEWEYPPYSGYFDGTFFVLQTNCIILSQCPGERLWGRGSNDDKSGLIAIMSSIESLLENEFEPTRSVVLSFGFDEEASGIYVRIFHSCSHSHF
jgi:Gly-Xaa carboxypeptidase